jgi:hypothetical protein
MIRLPALLVASIASLPLLLGCNVCHAHNGCPYQRDEPTSGQASGIHGASIAERLPIIRHRLGGTIEGLLVNRWGELWTEQDDGSEIAFSHDGTLVKQSDKVDESIASSDPFPVRDVDPDAIDRALKRIAKVDPGREFVKGELTRDDFLYGGLRWEIMVHSDEYYATYQAAPDGSEICLSVVSDHGESGGVHRCPDFGHQPKGIPAPE